MKPAMLDSFNEVRERNIISIKEAKEQGVKVIGKYCTYLPRELVLAAGAIPVSLCSTREEPIAAAEEVLPRNLCPLIKSSYGYAATDKCPYFHFCDLVMAETTCDGKKKMYEIMQAIKPVHVMQLPQTQQGEAALTMWHEEVLKAKRVIEDLCGVEVTTDALRQAIRLVNEENRALQALFDLNRAKPALISGMDLVKISSQISFHADRWQAVAMLDSLVSEIRDLAAQGYRVGEESSPRVLVTGTPVGIGSEKVVALAEQCGAVVVAMELCNAYKPVFLHIDEEDRRDPLLLLAEKYLHIPCSVMTPNAGRMDLLESLICDFRIDAVIDLTWQACHT
ncbi:MAG: double-cubane-cluster-containing anaerobic reductase, partial [Syntrophomonadaceae bacterium]|nr:double-cubane-cluster-containing anaerobic reductase [Syntrophomonadaceae bacterium]